MTQRNQLPDQKNAWARGSNDRWQLDTAKTPYDIMT
jgi:hypothetical protein